MTKVNFKLEGGRELEKAFKNLGKVPQKHVTSSSRKAMNIVLKQARADAPEEDGYLKQGMKLQGERSQFKGKKVYQVVFDRRWNHVFQKKNKEGQIVGYYPVSQEYGFYSKSGRYTPGFMFVRKSLLDNVRNVERTIVTEMKKKIDAEIAKEGLK